MELNITISDERRDLICRKYGYAETIQVDTGEFDKNSNPVYVEKPLSKEDFIYNWYAGVIDSDAVNQKSMEARAAAEQVIKESSVLDEPITIVRPTVTNKEIADAVLTANAKIEEATTKQQ